MKAHVVRTAALAAAMALTATPASAAWMQASSPHFIVYSDETPEALTKRVTDLELADAALRQLHATGETDGSDANRLTIFVTKSVGDLQRIAGDQSGMTMGFYVPRMSGSVAFTPLRAEQTGRAALTPQAVLLHEYAHHFLLGNFAMAYPAWFVEGYAEFASTMMFEPDHVLIGKSAAHRAREIFSQEGLSVRELFAPPKRMDTAQMLSIYGKGWALTHYLLFDRERARQFQTYLDAVNRGTPSMEAAAASFGDLRALDRSLDGYVRQRRLPARGIDRKALNIGKIALRPLSAGEAAMMDVRMRSTRGVSDKSAPGVMEAGERIAARFPGDPVVQGWFAEMAYDAGQDDKAAAAADRALAIQPDQSQALLYKARVLMRRAANAPSEAAWREARSFIVRANKVSNNDAAALALYYESYVDAGQAPTKNAVAALIRAQELVPQANDLRMRLVRHYLMAGQAAEARATLLPLANDPHASPDSMPRKILAAIDAKTDPKAIVTQFDAEQKAAREKAKRKEKG